jgi:hypothetical protein
MSRVYEFVCTLSGADELTDELEDALLEAGCNDAFLHSTGGVVFLDFDREAETLGDAIGSAVKDVEKAGYKVAKVEVEEPDSAG